MAGNTFDRAIESVPHGTPAGYKDGCRSNGGCPNRGTTRMTCLDASARYARDLHYRRAYDRGEIWLDRDLPVDTEKEAVRAAVARRAHQGYDLTGDHQEEPPNDADEISEPRTAAEASSPGVAAVASVEIEPSAVDKSETPRWRHGTVRGYDDHGCRCDACSEAKRRKNEKARTRTRARIEDGDRLPALQEDLAEARREIERLKAALAKATLLAGTAERLSELLAAEQAAHATTEAERGRLATELSGVRADATSARRDLAELVELTRRPNALAEVLRPPGISFDLVNGDLALTLHAHMQSSDVEQLRAYIGAGS
jgi:hypothetical protein